MTIWTIGHSNHSFDDFFSILNSFNIELLADIRSLPGSRKYPHFNKENLEIKLPGNGITYLHLAELGGRRKAKPDSKNTGWRHPAFRGYADYMESEEFRIAAENLKLISLQKRTVIMCAESLWWRCHRSLVADFMKSEGWSVIHIMGKGKGTEHNYREPARIIDGKITYMAEK